MEALVNPLGPVFWSALSERCRPVMAQFQCQQVYRRASTDPASVWSAPLRVATKPCVSQLAQLIANCSTLELAWFSTLTGQTMGPGLFADAAANATLGECIPSRDWATNPLSASAVPYPQAEPYKGGTAVTAGVCSDVFRNSDGSYKSIYVPAGYTQVACVV